MLTQPGMSSYQSVDRSTSLLHKPVSANLIQIPNLSYLPPVSLLRRISLSAHCSILFSSASPPAPFSISVSISFPTNSHPRSRPCLHPAPRSFFSCRRLCSRNFASFFLFLEAQFFSIQAQSRLFPKLRHLCSTVAAFLQSCEAPSPCSSSSVTVSPLSSVLVNQDHAFTTISVLLLLVSSPIQPSLRFEMSSSRQAQDKGKGKVVGGRVKTKAKKGRSQEGAYLAAFKECEFV